MKPNTPMIDPKDYIANYELNEYRYSAFWKGREYEHVAEVHLLQKLFSKYLPNLEKYRIMDIGGAYGRLAPLYAHTAKETILADYSTKELKAGIANLKGTFGNKVKYVALNAYKMPLKRSSVDALLSVRVMHHLKDTELFLAEVQRVLTPGGIAIIEFAHKNHILALLRNAFSLKSFLALPVLQVKHKNEQSQGMSEGQVSIMYNFSKNHVASVAQKVGLQVKGVYSCSFLRSGAIKKVLSTRVLLVLEKILQPLLRFTYMTPSLFIVLRKDGILVENKRTMEEILQCPRDMEPVHFTDGAYVCDKGDYFKQMDGDIVDLRDPRPESVDF